MALKLGFATSVYAGWGLADLVAKCQVLGLQGVEVVVAGREASAWGTQVLLSQPAATRKALEDAGLSVACLSVPVALHEAGKAGAGALAAAERAIELANALGAPVVRVLGYLIAGGESPSAAIHRVGTRLAGLAETASASGITVAVQNGGHFVRARDLWMVAEVANHAGAGVCWDIGAAGGESPTVAVPTLNSRIAHVHAWDADGAGKVVALGTGVLKNKLMMERLRGIGFEGFVSYCPPAGHAPEMAVAEAELGAAARALRAWAGLPELGPDGKPLPKVEEKPAAAAKPAAAGAAKPAAAKAAPVAKPEGKVKAAPAKAEGAGPAGAESAKG